LGTEVPISVTRSPLGLIIYGDTCAVGVTATLTSTWVTIITELSLFTPITCAEERGDQTYTTATGVILRTDISIIACGTISERLTATEARLGIADPVTADLLTIYLMVKYASSATTLLGGT
jgi:hypothetical protein